MKGSRARMLAYLDKHSKMPGIKCGTCSLPKDILEGVRWAKANGKHLTTVAEWLRSEGYPISGHRLTDHFRKHER